MDTLGAEHALAILRKHMSVHDWEEFKDTHDYLSLIARARGPESKEKKLFMGVITEAIKAGSSIALAQAEEELPEGGEKARVRAIELLLSYPGTILERAGYLIAARLL